MFLLEEIYQGLPPVLQNAACSLEGWRIRILRYNKNFHYFLSEAERRSNWTEEQMVTFRNKRLERFMKYSAKTTPFYREILSSLNIFCSDDIGIHNIKQMPILNKSMLQERLGEFCSSSPHYSKRVAAHTSGTTGAGLRFFTTRTALQEQWATWWRYRRWHGIDFGTWCGYFGGRSIVPITQKNPPFWRYNLPGKQILFSAYHMCLENMKAYVEELRRKQPPWLHGYPSLLTLLASYVLENRIDLGYQPSWITTGAENLLPQQFKLIYNAFGVPPRQHYGLAEAVANISECPLGNLHVDEDFAFVEFIKTGENNGYRVIGTNFSNPAFPLIRYDTQDVVELAKDGPCPCGRPGRLVKRIDGRQEDYIVLTNGVRLGRMDHIFKDLTNIREAQIYQRKRGEVIFRLVPGKNYTKKDEQLLITEARKRIGNKEDIRIEYLNKIERSRTAKLRFVISELPEAKLVY